MQKETNIKLLWNEKELIKKSFKWIEETSKYNYTYNFEWLGRPIIQFPQDMVALQEIVWSVKPELIIETGIAHGGSIIFSASMMVLLEKCGYINKGHIVAIDIDIRDYNRIEIEKHPLAPYITMIQGSSIDSNIINQVKLLSKDYRKVLILFDSNHTHEHVLAELEAYAPLTSVGSYCIVYDTAIEDMPEDLFSDKPWGIGNNPKTAVWEFLKKHKEFVIDTEIQNKLLITVAPDGYLKRIS